MPYTIPISFKTLMRKDRKHTECTLRESVQQNILLVLTTHFGEWRYDETYGCEIWDREFEALEENETWITIIENSVTKALQLHEPRLIDLRVIVRVKQEERKERPEDKDSPKRVRKLLLVETTGILHNDEQFKYVRPFYYSPISLD